MIQKSAVGGDKISDHFYLFTARMKLRTHLTLKILPHRIARHLARPLRKTLPGDPFFSPTATQIRSKSHHPPQAIAPRNEQRILINFHEQLGARLGIREHIPAQVRKVRSEERRV